MLYVFHGQDMKAAVEKARALANSLRAKKPDASFVEMDGDSWNASALEGHLGGQGLFSNKYIVFLNRVTENAEAKEGLASFAPAMQESPNIFIVLEGKLNAELKRAFEKDAEKLVECEPKAAAKPKSDSNVFAIANSVAHKDAVGAWKAYREAIDSGIEPENIAGVLFWKAKSTMDRGLAKKLMVSYHDSHRGLCDLELSLERELLKL